MLNNKWKKTLLGACFVAMGAACQPAETPEKTTDNGQTQQSEVLAALGRVEVLAKGADGVASFIRGDLGKVSEPMPVVGRMALRGSAAISADRALQSSLKRIAPAFRLSADELRVRSVVQDELGFSHVRYDQVKDGLPVVGGELILHVNAEGSVYAANGTARGGQAVAAAAKLDAGAAERAALGGNAGFSTSGSPRMVYLMDAAGRLSLSYEFTVVGAEREGLPVRDLVYVSATTGEVLESRPQIHSALNRALYSANNTYSTPGTLRRSEGGAATGDAHIDENYAHIGTTYNCYDTLFGRDSFDDMGGRITSTVHYGQSYVNAYWDGSQITFGDGDGFNSGMLGRDLDVVSHEISHGVTERESGLIYRNESGALNESFSDVAAAFCESWARNAVDADVWKIGEDIWTPGIAGDALRYMNNPTQDGSSKDYYPERYTGTSDNGGVHWNSGIPNLAFKLLVTGGGHPRGKTGVQVAGVGMHRAAQTWYFAATNYFTSTTTMSQARAYTVQAASDRYDSGTVDSVRNAWSAVGVP